MLKASLRHELKLCLKSKQTNEPTKSHLKSKARKEKNQTLLDIQSHLEVIQTLPTLISLWILVGSVLGGLLLLALLVFCLWKVSPACVGGRASYSVRKDRLCASQLGWGTGCRVQLSLTLFHK